MVHRAREMSKKTNQYLQNNSIDVAIFLTIMSPKPLPD
jgi:hypothetical protein